MMPLGGVEVPLIQTGGRFGPYRARDIADMDTLRQESSWWMTTI